MTLLYNYPLTTTFAGVDSLQANGVSGTGDALPSGIGDSLSIANGCMVAHLRDTDAQIGLGNRCEITAPVDAIGDERWYYYEWMVDGWQVGRQFSIQQIHDTPDGGDAARAPNFLMLYDGANLMAHLPQAQLPTESVNYNLIGAMPMAQGVWHSVMLHAKWSNAGAGLIDVYMDGYAVSRQINIGTAYTDVVGPYFKLGVYDYSHAGGFGERIGYFRNVNIWSGQERLNNALGGAPKCRPFAVKI